MMFGDFWFIFISFFGFAGIFLVNSGVVLGSFGIFLVNF